MTVWRVLRASGMKKTKPTKKLGLTERMKADADRPDFCRRHAHWSLKDWKNVIWSDETSVVLNHRRGGYRVWKTAEEKAKSHAFESDGEDILNSSFGGAFIRLERALSYLEARNEDRKSQGPEGTRSHKFRDRG